LAAVGLAVVIVTLTPVSQWWTVWLTGNRWDAAAGDTLIVLGGSTPMQPGSFLSYSSYCRSVYTVFVWRSAKFRQIVISGGTGTADSMRRYLVAEGVPAEVIRVEENSLTTEENARFTAAMLRGSSPGKVALLSSDYHMRRAVAMFERAGFHDLTVLPAPDAGKRNTSRLRRWEVCLDLITETVKLVAYRIADRA
jgi:uncharacterized SAM-binding protein YcdF (DUF218 family)